MFLRCSKLSLYRPRKGLYHQVSYSNIDYWQENFFASTIFQLRHPAMEGIEEKSVIPSCLLTWGIFTEPHLTC